MNLLCRSIGFSLQARRRNTGNTAYRTCSTFRPRMLASLCIAACAGYIVPVAARAELVVQLRDNPIVTSRHVTLADVADVSSTTTSEKTIAEHLDLIELKPTEQATMMNRSYVRIRLQVAGWGSDEIRLSGPEKIFVEYEEPQPIADEDIEVAAMKTIQKVLGIPAEELRVRLVSPFVTALPTGVRNRSDLRVEVLPPTAGRLGQVSLNVMLWEGRNVLARRTGRFEVLRRHRVAVTRVSLQREATISESDIQFENRFLSTKADEPTEEDVYGQRVRISMKPGQILSLRDVVPPAPKRAEMSVKRGSKVRVIATSGLLKIELRQAEALEDGRIGDYISLRNMESKQVIIGRVVDAGQVAIRLR